MIKRLAIFLSMALVAVGCQNQELKPMPLPTSTGEGTIVFNGASSDIQYTGLRYNKSTDIYEFYLSSDDLKTYDDLVDTKQMLYIKIDGTMIGWQFLMNDDFEFKYTNGNTTYSKSNFVSGSIYISIPTTKTFDITLTNITTDDGKTISGAWSGTPGGLK